LEGAVWEPYEMFQPSFFSTDIEEILGCCKTAYGLILRSESGGVVVYADVTK